MPSLLHELLKKTKKIFEFVKEYLTTQKVIY